MARESPMGHLKQKCVGLCFRLLSEVRPSPTALPQIGLYCVCLCVSVCVCVCLCVSVCGLWGRLSFCMHVCICLCVFGSTVTLLGRWCEAQYVPHRRRHPSILWKVCFETHCCTFPATPRRWAASQNNAPCDARQNMDPVTNH